MTRYVLPASVAARLLAGPLEDQLAGEEWPQVEELRAIADADGESLSLLNYDLSSPEEGDWQVVMFWESRRRKVVGRPATRLSWSLQRAGLARAGSRLWQWANPATQVATTTGRVTSTDTKDGELTVHYELRPMPGE